MRTACRKSGLSDAVQRVRKWRPAVLVCLSCLGEGRRRSSTSTAGCPFNREKMYVRHSPSWFCLRYCCVPLQADHFPFHRGGCRLWTPEGCGLLQSWVFLHGSSSVLSQPALGTCQECLSASGRESPSGSWMQPVLGPTLTLVSFITLLLPPRTR